MKVRMMRAVLGAAVVCGLAVATGPARAGDLPKCVSAKEAEAFSLRHLQSRLMVAGLACNQRDAYNSFIQAFQPPLAAAGGDLIAYFKRTGGGQAALNRHVTELANVAGLHRAADPQAFCQETWTAFLQLQDAPADLGRHAAALMLKNADHPVLCETPAPVITADAALTSEAPPVVKTSAQPAD